MREHVTFAISWRVVFRVGLRAAAVYGLLYELCKREYKKAGGEGVGLPWVSLTQVQIAHMLGLEVHTAAKFLHLLESQMFIYVRKCGQKGGRKARSYTIAPQGFFAMGNGFSKWKTKEEPHLLFWGADTRIASQVGIAEAVVFQYFWFWQECHHYTSRLAKEGRAKSSYTLRALAHQLPFMGEAGVRKAAGHLKESGFVVCTRREATTFWQIGDAGFKAMQGDVLCFPPSVKENSSFGSPSCLTGISGKAKRSGRKLLRIAPSAKRARVKPVVTRNSPALQAKTLQHSLRFGKLLALWEGAVWRRPSPLRR